MLCKSIICCRSRVKYQTGSAKQNHELFEYWMHAVVTCCAPPSTAYGLNLSSLIQSLYGILLLKTNKAARFSHLSRRYPLPLPTAWFHCHTFSSATQSRDGIQGDSGRGQSDGCLDPHSATLLLGNEVAWDTPNLWHSALSTKPKSYPFKLHIKI